MIRFQDVHVTDNAKVGQQGEDDEELHDRGVGLPAVLVLSLAEHERLIRIAESLGDHGHYHGNLHASTVDAQFGLGRFRVAVHQREDDFVGRLVQDACNTENQDGPTVAQHTFHQPGVEPIFESCRSGMKKKVMNDVQTRFRMKAYPGPTDGS